MRSAMKQVFRGLLICMIVCALPVTVLADDVAQHGGIGEGVFPMQESTSTDTTSYRSILTLLATVFQVNDDGSITVPDDGGNNGTGGMPNVDGTHNQDHPLTHVLAVPATKDNPGNREYWYCAKCDKYYADAAGTQEIAKADTVIPRLTENPKTGDRYDPMLWGILMAACVVSMLATYQCRPKHKTEKIVKI